MRQTILDRSSFLIGAVACYHFGRMMTQKKHSGSLVRTFALDQMETCPRVLTIIALLLLGAAAGAEVCRMVIGLRLNFKTSREVNAQLWCEKPKLVNTLWISGGVMLCAGQIILDLSS